MLLSRQQKIRIIQEKWDEDSEEHKQKILSKFKFVFKYDLREQQTGDLKIGLSKASSLNNLEHFKSTIVNFLFIELNYGSAKRQQ